MTTTPRAVRKTSNLQPKSHEMSGAPLGVLVGGLVHNSAYAPWKTDSFSRQRRIPSHALTVHVGCLPAVLPSRGG